MKQKLVEDMVNQATQANGVINEVNDTASFLINSMVLDYHQSSALSNYMYCAYRSVKQLVAYLGKLQAEMEKE